MSSLSRHWLGTTILIGMVYCAIGVLFALPSNQVRLWRPLAWVASVVIYAVHIGYEHFRRGSSSPATAWHTALAVAIGAFGLAVAANVHEVFFTSSYRRALALALVLWPVLIGLPAFVVALVMAYGLGLTRRLS